MPMDQLISQLPVADQVRALSEAVLRARQAKEGATKEEAEWLDQLAQAEALAAGLGIPLSGLIESNPYLTNVKSAPAGTQGDLVDPNTGESGGGA